jgi:hypothetical protein
MRQIGHRRSQKHANFKSAVRLTQAGIYLDTGTSDLRGTFHLGTNNKQGGCVMVIMIIHRGIFRKRAGGNVHSVGSVHYAVVLSLTHLQSKHGK